MVSGESIITVPNSVFHPHESDKFQTLLNTVNGFEEFILDIHGFILSSNLEAVTITGYEEWEVIGKSISIFYSPSDQERKEPASDLEKTRHFGKHISSGFRVKKKGQPFFAKMKFSVINNETGLQGFRVVLYDSTHRALYTVGTRKMKEEYLSLFNNRFVGIFKFRLKDFGFLMVNDKALEIIQRPRHETRFNTLFFYESDLNTFQAKISNERGINDFEFRLNVPGAERYVSVSCRAFVRRGFVEGIISDVTEKLNHLHQIETLNHELDNFLYHASHDIRAPLPTIQGLVNLIKAEECNKDVAIYTAMIEDQVKNMDAILQDLSQIAFNNAQPVHFGRMSVKSTVLALLNDFQRVHPITKVKFEIDERVAFYSDEKRIAVIFQNLLSNAFKYSQSDQDKPMIKIKIRINLSNMIAQVEDNGCGIDTKYLKDIFKLFFKIDSSRHGSGLGLYVVQMMLKKLKGHIDVTSRIKVGTCVSFTIPNQKPF